jgi:hypothetical protein
MTQILSQSFYLVAGFSYANGSNQFDLSIAVVKHDINTLKKKKKKKKKDKERKASMSSSCASWRILLIIILLLYVFPCSAPDS